MKVLVNGGLNLSTLDGWWEEAYALGLGWAIGDAEQDVEQEHDRRDAEDLYVLLENEVVPEFYNRDATGVPRAWVARMARSMTGLTVRYSATRMVREYLDKAYLPAARALRERVADAAAPARIMAEWDRHLRRAWPDVHIGEMDLTAREVGWDVSVPVYLGEIAAKDVVVEVYADRADGAAAEVVALISDGAVPGATSGYFFRGQIAGTPRPASDYTVRVIPSHPGVRVPGETSLIRWQK
jgi:starch phosphorylase